MKRYFKIFIPVLCATVLAAGCSKEGTSIPGQGTALVLSPSVDGNDTRAGYNYKAKEYFELAGYEKADVISNNAIVPYVYNETLNELTAAAGYDPFVFPADGSTLSITVKWPAEEQRRALDFTGHKDQSDKTDFLLADFLTTSVSVYPSKRVTINLGHERSKITFTLEGAFNGQSIEELYINGYSAYCDPVLGDAQLIVLPAVGPMLLGKGATGALKVSGDPGMYTFTLSAAVTGFEAGSHHTIRLNLD